MDEWLKGLFRKMFSLRPLRREQSMFRFRTSKQVLFEFEARVHLLYMKRLQLIIERSTGRELLCGTFLSAQESSILQQKRRLNIKCIHLEFCEILLPLTKRYLIVLFGRVLRMI